jgi:hypothetical protein
MWLKPMPPSGLGAGRWWLISVNIFLQGTTSVLAEKGVTLSERPVLPRVEGPL